MSADAVRSAAGLVARGFIAPEKESEIDEVARRYAVAIPAAMADLIDPRDPADPIARQFVPSAAELEKLPQERADPIGDDAHSPVEGLVHRYPDRVLLKLLHACPVYCRFCFRREVVGPGGPQILSRVALDQALDYIRARQGVSEVILTGGDPLALSPRRLGEVLERLGEIAHLRFLRIHTRAPLAAPDLVSSELVEALRRARRPVWIAVHANHPREFTAAGRQAVATLADAGFPLVSQTVLLRGVNDDADILAELMRRFLENRIKPYYLHHADLAQGTAHFRTSVDAGLALMRSLRGRLSGLAQPLYVLDIPGGHGKAPLGPSYLRQDGEGLAVQDWRGDWRGYADSPDQKKT